MTRQEVAPWRAGEKDPAPARAAGLLVLFLSAGRAVESASRAVEAALPERKAAVLQRGAGRAADAPWNAPARLLHASALALASSVLADSAVEHYRGSFENPGMFAPLVTSAFAMLAGILGVCDPRPERFRRRAYRTATGTGAAGLCFHVWNLLRRPGRLTWQNLFYGAPIGAPAALSLAGLVGEAAETLACARPGEEPRLAGMPAGRALAGFASIGIAGTSAEAALLHFRGAFHNPLMMLPVSIPPLAALLLGRAALSHPGCPTVPRAALAMTALLGPIGVGLHAYGVSRAMGGWRNWSQNVIDGPPLPAPPAFSALALVGLVGLALLETGDGNP